MPENELSWSRSSEGDVATEAEASDPLDNVYTQGNDTDDNLAPFDNAPDAAPTCRAASTTTYSLVPVRGDALHAPSLARALIQAGERVGIPLSISTFLNYYGVFGETSGSEGGFRFTAATVPRGAADGVVHYDLFLGVSSPAVASDERRPIHVTFSIDTSDSMRDENLGLAKAAIRKVADALGVQDTVSIATWNEEQPVMLAPMSPATESGMSALNTALDRLEAGGVANFRMGLDAAYEVAAEVAAGDSLIMLISDGREEVGITDKDLVAAQARQSASPIRLMAVGVSADPSRYNSQMMQLMSASGRGAHLFIDSLDETERLFADRPVSLMTLTATDVSLTLTLPPSHQLVAASPEPGAGSSGIGLLDMAPGAALAVSLNAAICDPDATSDGRLELSMSYTDPITGEHASAAAEPLSLGALLENETALETKIGAVVAYVEMLKKVRTLGSAAAGRLIDKTAAAVGAALETLPGDPALEEIAALVDGYRGLF